MSFSQLRSFVLTRAMTMCLIASHGLAPLTTHSLHAQSLPRISFAKPEWTSAESFSQLTSVRELNNGNVIVADYQDVTVQLLGNTGRRISEIGRKGSGPAEYLFPGRLIALAADTTLIVDRDARKFLLVDPRGKITETHPFPAMLADGAEFIRGGDAAGRLYFRVHSIQAGAPATSEPIARWRRGASSFDTIASISIEVPKGKLIRSSALPKGSNIQGRPNVRFAAVDDWAVSPTGRVAILHAAPYRVDWVDANRSTTRGAVVAYKAIPVTDADRKRYEPKGPPFVRPYAAVKSPFVAETAVIDSEDNLWVMRHEIANAPSRRWDVFSATGKHLGSIPLSSDRVLLALTRRSAFLVRTDADGLQWLERYPR